MFTFRDAYYASPLCLQTLQSQWCCRVHSIVIARFLLAHRTSALHVWLHAPCLGVQLLPRRRVVLLLLLLLPLPLLLLLLLLRRMAALQ